MINYSYEHIGKIKIRFGDHVYNKGLLEVKNFTTPMFDELLDIIEIDLIKAYEKWRINNWNSFYTIFKSSILFERELDKRMNYSINVFRPKSQRKTELGFNTQIPSMTIDMILENEMEDQDKTLKADYTIDNFYNFNDSYQKRKEELSKQINNIHKSLMKKDNNYHDYNRDIGYKNIMM
jgi:dephospho-CoA kinase